MHPLHAVCLLLCWEDLLHLGLGDKKDIVIVILACLAIVLTSEHVLVPWGLNDTVIWLSWP